MEALVEAEMETLEEQNPKNRSDYDDDDRMSIEMEYDGGDESDEKTLLYRQLTFADMVAPQVVNSSLSSRSDRADIARLPFASSSIDAVHAGAALHCWPSPSAGVAEISRILRPGGVFVATTYIVDGLYSFIPFLSPIRQPVLQPSNYERRESRM
uniref:Uncharacterized methyltransferase At1g78140, chloroplastic n=1 Tax=Tanacetum cinerariifolium TaxID=118510 RepID=A0A6L2NIE4_TANCI|nr:uncharacterized methyltransferase At1g78140, chloroplastic [Tanacetum cinerariifolium]